MITFRPIPVLTLFTLASLALLLTLGSWQVQRMNWKRDMIAAYEARGEASSLAEALCAGGEGQFGPRVRAPRPLLGRELNYYALRDQPGWVRVGAMQVEACAPESGPRFLLIESGFEPFTGGTVVRPEAWRIDPLPEPGPFTPLNDPDTNQWYRFDVEAMAEALDLPADALLGVWARSDFGMPASLSTTPPARHFGYALTWFGLAAALVGVYIALHVGRGRLSLGRQAKRSPEQEE